MRNFLQECQPVFDFLKKYTAVYQDVYTDVSALVADATTRHTVTQYTVKKILGGR